MTLLPKQHVHLPPHMAVAWGSHPGCVPPRPQLHRAQGTRRTHAHERAPSSIDYQGDSRTALLKVSLLCTGQGFTDRRDPLRQLRGHVAEDLGSQSHKTTQLP